MRALKASEGEEVIAILLKRLEGKTVGVGPKKQRFVSTVDGLTICFNPSVDIEIMKEEFGCKDYQNFLTKYFISNIIGVAEDHFGEEFGNIEGFIVTTKSPTNELMFTISI